MSKEKRPQKPINEGYQPMNLNKGYQPHKVEAVKPSKPQAGHIPTISQGGSSTPPNQGSGGTKK